MTVVSGYQSFGLPVAESVRITVDFGPADGPERGVTTVWVPATWVRADRRIVCVPAAEATEDHDLYDAVLERITAQVVRVEPGVGFEVAATAGYTSWGRYSFDCVQI